MATNDNHRYEDVKTQQREVASSLWAVVGLPPISNYPPPTPKRLGGQTTPVTRRTASAPSQHDRTPPRSKGDRHVQHGLLRHGKQRQKHSKDEGYHDDGSTSHTQHGKTSAGVKTHTAGAARLFGSGEEDAGTSNTLDSVLFSNEHDFGTDYEEEQALPNLQERISGAGGLLDGLLRIEAETGGYEEEDLLNSRRRRLLGGDAFSKASNEVRNRIIPTICRARVKACETNADCALELER